ncbi:MAG: DNA polymerase III subunit beta [Ectothiorhodospiraceae bacterium]|nr:DNA polymerase III subunit beta [Ectothiorhodospiraceae bacterium]
MKFSIQREALLKPLQTIVGVVERRQTLPVLSNILVIVTNDTLSMTATDLEVEMIATTPLENAEPGDITIPARKMVDICRALPEGATIQVSLDTEKQRVTIRSGKSRFNLATLPISDFPSVDEITSQFEFSLPQNALKRLIEKTSFAMAQQDVRYYLNGLLLEIAKGAVRSVATDGHRLALSSYECDINPADTLQIIVPRKGVGELVKLLEDSDEPVNIQVSNNHIKIAMKDLVFTSKLIDGRFPDYQRVIPSDSDKHIVADRELLRHALLRTSILSNEKYRGIRLRLSDGLIQAQANNPEMEEAEEEIQVTYSGESLEIGFNVSYFLDALATVSEETVAIELGDANSSCVIRPQKDDSCTYVIMPMRL